jgi:hypothetical protein
VLSATLWNQLSLSPPEGGIGTVEHAAELPAGTRRLTTEQELAHIVEHGLLLRLVQLWNGAAPARFRFSAWRTAAGRSRASVEPCSPERSHNRRETKPHAPENIANCPPTRSGSVLTSVLRALLTLQIT